MQYSRKALQIINQTKSEVSTRLVFARTVTYILFCNNSKFLCFYRNGDEILLNSSAGHLVRSKPASDGEGGNLNGAGALDSIILTS